MPKMPLIKPRTIVALLYDMEYDAMTAQYGDGTVSHLPYSKELDAISQQYTSFLRAVNGIPGPYLDAYTTAVEAFSHA